DEPTKTPANAVGEGCATLPAVARYVTVIRQRVAAHWIQAKGGRGEVVVRMSIRATGELAHAEIASAATPEAGAACLAAVRDAAPFPAMAAERDCMADRELELVFQGPPSR